MKKVFLLLVVLLTFLPSSKIEASTLSCSQIDGMSIFGYKYNEYIFIGAIANEYNSESIANEYGAGNKYSSNSIFNDYGSFGGEYSSYSAFNDYASKPPIIINDDYKFVGYLTTGYKTQNINTYEAIACAKNSYSSSNRDMKDITFKSIPSSSYSGGYTQPNKYTCPLNSHTSITDITKCDCDVGYQINSAKDACILTPIKTENQLCQDTYGINSYSLSSGKCQCNTGYEWEIDNKSCVKSISCDDNNIKVGNKCITLDESCQNTYGLNSTGIIGSKKSDNTNSCNCKTGYEWNSGRTACVVYVAPMFSGCISTIGYSATTGMSCDGTKKCSDGMLLNSNKTECTPIQITSPTKVASQKPPVVITKDKLKIPDIKVEQKNEIVPITNTEPIKKISWYQKILSWFKKK